MQYQQQKEERLKLKVAAGFALIFIPVINQ
jgi:hypothetical protein